MELATTINNLIKKRRSVFPSSYMNKPVPKEIIEQVLENANWAPTHKKTEPWRFKVLIGEKQVQLGQSMAEWYKENTPEGNFSPMVFKKFAENPTKPGCLIAICMKRDPKESVAEWEEIAAVSMAVQNMYLTCTAYGLGSFWSTPRPALNADKFLGLQEGERCLGLFYIGYFEGDLPEGSRESDAQSKVEWL